MKIMLVFLAIIASAPTFAEPVAPFGDKTTLGGRLEVAFTKVLSQCGIPELVIPRRWSSDIKLSAVPAPLQTSLELGSTVTWSEDQSIARLFTYVYEQPSLSLNVLRDSSWLITKDNLSASAATMQPNGISRIGFNFDCAGTVAAALSANSTLAFPIATVQSALSTKFSGSKKTTLSLASGQFESPLLNMLDAGAPSSERLRGLMYLSDWYRRSPEPATPYQMLSSLSGIAMFESNQTMDSFQANVDATTQLRFPAFALNASTNGGNSVGYGLTVTKFYVGIKNLSGQPVLTWQPMPGPIQIAAQLAGFKTALDPSTNLNVLPGATILHRQTLLGMPVQFCNSNYWTAIPKLGTLGLRLVDARRIASAGSLTDDSCEFIVSYDVPSKPTNEIIAQYHFETSLPMVAKDGSAVPLRIQAQDVRYQINQSPELFPLSFDPKHTSDPMAGLTWLVPFAVRDDSGIADLTKPVKATATLDCKKNTYSLDASPLSVQPAGRTANLSLKYLPSSEQLEMLKNGTMRQSKCRVNATLDFAVLANAALKLKKEVRFEIYFPEPIEPLAPVAAMVVGETSLNTPE